MRLAPIDRRAVLHLAVLVASPLLPLALSAVPVEDLLRAVVTMFV
jgi:hypothetical protein